MLIEFIDEAIKGSLQSPADVGIEQTLGNFVLWIKLFVEMIGALLIAVGAGLAMSRLIKVFLKPTLGGYEGTRLILSRFLSLALEFQLAADILATTVAPSWTQIGKLGAIAVIRTGLNYFLAGEMKEEEDAIDGTERVTT
ncbi:MAG TPA: DUF1622 domain-containing protein [Pyrinomonadaceae bacterium]|nr:DUF1622 domain-containing protein [Pyrinomonadaceae bacterium]